MVTHDIKFTTGQFAKLHHINKRTLHYYDSIGLFSPEHVGENGYRYYTYLQSSTLEMLLTMRELGMSICEIDMYMKNRSAEAFHEIIMGKTAEIDEDIKRLKEIKRLLAMKEEQLRICKDEDMDNIEIIECDKEYLLLGEAIADTYDEKEFTMFIERAHTLSTRRIFNKSYGCMISVEKIVERKFNEDDCFFAKMEKDFGKSGLYIKPKGRYIRAFCKGSWDKLPNTYDRIIEFAIKNGLTLKGYFYEEGINEMTILCMDEYITQITCLCV